MEHKTQLPQNIQADWDSFSQEEKSTVELLLEIGQEHLFNHWSAVGQDTAAKKKLIAQAARLDTQYPGGLKAYVNNAKKLLEESRLGVNPYDGYTPSVPSGERLQVGSAEFDDAEAQGLLDARYLAFVLVAGGLGERLGYNGIKLELPAEITTGKPFLQNYCENILALQNLARQQSGSDVTIPLFIMTSGDTHDKTVALLQTHQNFGMAPDQIILAKQELVPSLKNNQGQFALQESDPYEISVKPHGHGDVHTLLYQTGTVNKWLNEGRKWVIFFQDTNGIVFHALMAALGVSKKNSFEVNSLTVPRKPGEAVGGICKLTHNNNSSITINVEYNQLDPLLRGTISPQGDVPDASGFSPYPGNINVLIFALEPYTAVLNRTKGAIPEFVNPKYQDKAKTEFKPTRLECMMQDYPKLLESGSKVGFTQLERWISFSAVKNNVVDAAKKAQSTGFPESASSGESDIYYFNRRVAVSAGVHIQPDGVAQDFAGIPVQMGARLVFSPFFGLSIKDIQSRFKTEEKKNNINISNQSTLVIDGQGQVTFENLDLDGALVIKTVAGANVHVKKLRVHNAGWHFSPVQQDDASVAEKYKIRGYKLEQKEQRELVFNQAGEFTVDE